MKHLTLAITAIMLAGSVITAQAQEEPKFSVKPTGRMLFDGAVYGPDTDGFSDGVAMPDIRLGAKASYGNWAAKIDVGFKPDNKNGEKLSMKDIYMQYSFNPYNLIRVGYFVHQFGLNAATSSSMKPAMEEATPNVFFNATGRNLGVMWVYDKDDWFSGISLFAASNSMFNNSNTIGKTSVGALNRLVWRPAHDEGSIAQIGISLWYQSAQHNAIKDEETGESKPGPGYFDFSATFPTRVASVKMLGANITDSRSVFKLTPELVLAKDRIALESQYYYMNVNRKNGLHHYQAQGAYGLLRGLLIGDKYTYSSADAGLATPAPGSLEMLLGYAYTNASYRKSGILGGISNDYSVSFTYYINKYMLARLRYSYTNVRSSDVMYKRHVNAIQARLQFIF